MGRSAQLRWAVAGLALVAVTAAAQVAGLPDYATHMPVYSGTLSDTDIVAVLSWIKSRWTPEVRARHDEINRQAQALR